MPHSITISYRCRDIGYGEEAGVLTGNFTGEVDWSGKATFITDEGFPYYFFADEIEQVETEGQVYETKGGSR